MNRRIKLGDLILDCKFDKSNDHPFVIIEGKRKYFKYCTGCNKIQLYGLKSDMLRYLNKKCLGCRDYRGEKHPMFGHKQSDYVKQRIRESQTGRIPSIKQRKLQSLRMSGKNHPMYGKHHTDETKLKLRLIAIQRRESNCGRILCPRYNPKACKYLETLNSTMGWNLMHAKNGGEHYIKELGYWVDGYDKNRNIVVEYDEKHHYDIHGNLKEKDVRRQGEIVESLGCEFYRYNENLDTLIKINCLTIT